MHSSLHIASSHLKKVVGGFDFVPVRRLCRDTAVDRAVLHSVRHGGERILMVRMLVVVLGHLVDLQIPGETRRPVEHVEILARVLWGY